MRKSESWKNREARGRTREALAQNTDPDHDRKAMLCAISRGDEVVARERYFRLPDDQKDLCESRQLMHKVAMRSDDTNLAAECLESVAKHADTAPEYLYACVLDALQSGYERQGYIALQKILETSKHTTLKGVHLPALIRCMLRMLKTNIKQNGEQQEDVESALDAMCSLFEAAVEHAKKTPAVSNDLTANELAWLSKCCYNTAIEYLARINPGLLRRFCVACSWMIEALDRDTPAAEKAQLRLRRIFCEYLGLTATVVLARAEEHIDTSLNHYLAASKHGKNLRQYIVEHLTIEGLSDNIKLDLITKHTQAIKFELEAAMRLQKWDELSNLFEQCWKFEDPKHWSTLADLAFNIYDVLCATGDVHNEEVYQKTILTFIQQVVNKSWTGQDSEKVAQHLRCLFHLSLGKTDTVAIHCIDQISKIAAEGKKVSLPTSSLEPSSLSFTSFPIPSSPGQL